MTWTACGVQLGGDRACGGERLAWPDHERRYHARMLRAVLAGALMVVAGCGTAATSPARTDPVPSAPSSTVECEPVPRIRLDGVEYQVRRLDDPVPASEVGDVIAEQIVVPESALSCEPAPTLLDGEGTYAYPTVHRLNDVDEQVAVTAALPGGPYLRFVARGAAVPAGDEPSVDGPVVRQPMPFGQDALAALIEGEVVLDGGCLYVVQPPGDLRFPVLWPSSTTWDESAQAVVLADGRMLSVGSFISAGGGYFSVGDLGWLVDDEAVAALSLCAEPPYREVAVINNQPDAVSSAPG